MILAVDIGNSQILLGCLRNGEIVTTARLATAPERTEDEYAVAIREILAFRGVDVRTLEGAILSSVVGPLNAAMTRAIELLIGRRPLVVGKGVKTGLNIRIDDPGQVGANLVVAAVAGMSLCPPPLILIDLGTATTMAAVDKDGCFVGGAILPGVRLSMEALSSGTSQLPRVSLDVPKKCIGTNTVACMQSGAIFGAAAMLDGMIDRMEEELGQSAQVLASGDLAEKVIPACRRVIRVEPELSLKGLAVLWEKNKR